MVNVKIFHDFIALCLFCAHLYDKKEKTTVQRSYCAFDIALKLAFSKWRQKFGANHH